MRLDWEWTPARITLFYLLFGTAALYLSDVIFVQLIVDPVALRQLQALKGAAEVLVTAGLIYWLTTKSRREVERTNAHLETALQQTQILHRVLRHNLRNVCTIIHGHAELLADRHDESLVEHVETIADQTDRLVNLSEKTTQLRRVAEVTDSPRTRVDLVAVVESAVATVRSTYPDVEFHTELPDHAYAVTSSHISAAIDELIENAVEHNDADDPRVRITITTPAADRVALTVADNGPGIPDMEREVLAEGNEAPTFHSQGLGLWLVRMVVTAAEGDLKIEDNDPRGTLVRTTLPRASAGGVGVDSVAGLLDEDELPSTPTR